MFLAFLTFARINRSLDVQNEIVRFCQRRGMAFQRSAQTGTPSKKIRGDLVCDEDVAVLTPESGELRQ